MVAVRHFAVTFAALCVLAVAPSAHAVDNLKAFPPAEEGTARFVINLPRQKDETALKVELIVGKVVRTDAANRYFFGGALDPQLLRYNSQLPLEVYLPKGVEVRYRLWHASPTTQRARPG